MIAYSDGEVRQQFNVCLRARTVGGIARVTDEAREVRWVSPADIDTLEMHPTQRLRIRHALDTARSSPYLG
ncbi:NUDIX hydrolase [Spongiactinospora rosea]|uniref:hypothetical protein n=1 Tax=Spongiactinospora rosea TaxID=2248750 RepID=UPI0026D2AB57|nr:hypothetical protein [Spongiactinospora rosea]